MVKAASVLRAPSAYRVCACGALRYQTSPLCRSCTNAARMAVRTPRVLFEEKVFVAASGCHIWMGAATKRGYGSLFSRGVRWQAHRFAYVLAKGAIPEGLTIDHLCRKPACVNPDHLEAVPLRVNILRGKAGEQARQTHCLRGHPFSGDNLRVYRGKRFCLACKKLLRKPVADR